MNESNIKKLEIDWMELLRKIVKGGRNRPPSSRDTNEDEIIELNHC